MTTTYIGLIDGLHTWEVRDDSGTIVGTNRSAFPPRPDGDGWTLDEATGTWVEA